MKNLSNTFILNLKNILSRNLGCLSQRPKDSHILNPSNRETMIQKTFDFFERYNCLFIHIPKTAGLAIFQSLFDRDSRGHFSIREYISVVGNEAVASRTKVCVVRNPYDRLLSAYTYLRQGGRGHQKDLFYQNALTKYPDFETFVKELVISKKVLEFEHFLPQSEFVVDYSGKVLMDYIGRYEEIEESFLQIRKRIIGDGRVLEKYNVTPNRDGNFMDYYDDEMEMIVRKTYETDFELFGY